MNVVKSALYSIDVDSELNRLYLTLDGTWEKVYTLPDLSKDLEQATHYLHEGFTCCTDMTKAVKTNADSHAMISYSKFVLMEKGIRKDAFILTDSEWLDIDFNTTLMQMQGKAFDAKEEAERWLSMN